MATENIIVNIVGNVKGFLKAMGASQEEMKKTAGKTVEWKKNMRLATTMGGRLALRVRKMTHGMRGFRMEMLGVMFFGLGLQKFFKGLLQPALQLTGVFELFSNVLAILFLPIALALLDWLMPIFDWLMNLSEATKLLIGKWVLFGFALGALLFLFGMFALGIGSVILAFAGVFLVIDRLIPDITILGVNMSSFIEAGLGIALVTTAFEFLKNTVSSLLEKFFELEFVKDTLDKLGIALDDSKTPWENFKIFVKGVIDSILEKLGLLTGEKGKSPFTTIQDMIDDVKTTFNEWIEEFKTKIDELDIPSFITGIEDLAESITNLTPTLETFAKWLDAIADVLGVIGKIFRIGQLPPEELTRTNIKEILGTNPGQQLGGIIPRTGLRMLHEGERVIPAGDTFTSSPNITINASPGMDIHELARAVSEILASDLSALARR